MMNHMVDPDIISDGTARDYNSFKDATFEIRGNKDGDTWLKWTVEGEPARLVVIPSWILTTLAWNYLDQVFWKYLKFIGLNSFFDIVNLASGKRTILKQYPLTDIGFKRRYKQLFGDN